LIRDNMTRRSFLTLGLGLALVLSSLDARADKFPAVPPQPKLFASVYGVYAFKTLPDGSVGNSEGVFFTLDEHAKRR
jgi:hypothetical protein